jgi:hypothetical protein
MNPVPANPILFWACFVGGTVGPILGSFLTSFARRPLNDQAFLLLWLLWLSGTILLISCAWSVRAILLGRTAKSHQPTWLYRLFGWLAVAELVLWGYTVVRTV